MPKATSKEYTPAEFAEALSRLDSSGYARWAPKAIKTLTGEVYKRAKELCPVDTGHLRRSFKMSTQLGADCYTGTVSNPVYYASYVEYGHKTANRTGWVEGQHFLEKAVTRVESHKTDILTADLQKFLDEELE